MRAIFFIAWLMASINAFTAFGYDAAVLFALKEDQVDFAAVQPMSAQPLSVGSQQFFPFMTGGGRFIAGATRAGLVETMDTVVSACARLNAKRLISFGLAGVLTDRYEAGDVVIVRYAGRHDRGNWSGSGEFQPRNTALAEVPADDLLNRVAEAFVAKCREKGLRVHDGGRLVSGDAFITSDMYRAKLARDFEADLVDMNTGAFAVAMDSFRRPGLLIRVVSDRADARASEDFAAFVGDRARTLKPAATALAEALRELERE